MNKYFRLLICALFIAATPHPLGWKSSPRHAKGLKQMVAHPAYKVAPLPESFSLRSKMGGRYNQLQLGSCVANAGCKGFAYVWKEITGKEIDPSRLDVYQNCLKFDGGFPNDNGTYTSTCLRVFREKGALLEKKWPYRPENLAITPTRTGGQRAWYAATKTYDVSNTDNGYSLKQAIANARLPVMVGGYVYEQIFSVSKGHPYIDMPRGHPAGGHEMLAVGYDDNKVFNGQKGFVLLMNSWGDEWGDDGFAWIPYAYIFNPRYFEDFGCIEATGRRIKTSTSPVRSQSINRSPQRRSGFIEPKKAFIGPTALLEEINGQMRWRLMRDVIYQTPNGDIITAKEGLITDLASIPRWAWSILPPWHPTYGRAALIHDQLYRNHGRMHDRTYTRKESDEVFRYAMRDLGASCLKRNTMFTAVRIGNPEWN